MGPSLHLHLGWCLRILRILFFLSPTSVVSAVTHPWIALEMGVYTELPADLTEVDVIIAGGKSTISGKTFFSSVLV